MKRRIASLLLALAAACGDGPTASVTSDVVRVTRGDNGLRIENLTDTPRAFSANDPNWLALAAMDLSLLAVCNTPDETCLRLPARTSVLVPFSEIGGYNGSTTEVLVMTWRVVETAPSEYQPQMDAGVTLKL